MGHSTVENMTPLTRHGSLKQLGYGVPFDTVRANAARWKGWGAGKTALVTGGNAGLGFFTALGLAASGARVVIASRSVQRSARAKSEILRVIPAAKISHWPLDTADYASVDGAAERAMELELDILIANAGMIHAPTSRHQSPSGDELVLATNYLGHARLVGRLAEQFRARPLRLIGLGSMATRLLRVDPGNLALHDGYGAYRAYAQSKAALQAFSIGLDHRLKQLSWPARSIAVHPGYSVSGLTVMVPGINEPGYAKRLKGQLQSPIAQGKHQGAVPIVEAALNPGIDGCERGIYLGPRYLNKGTAQFVKPVGITRRRKLLDPVWELFRQANGGADPFGS